jgi:hypothetical protein
MHLYAQQVVTSIIQHQFTNKIREACASLKTSIVF